MESEEKVVSYTKHHMMTCKADGHELTPEQVDAKLDEVSFVVESSEWSFNDRRQWDHDEKKWEFEEAEREVKKRRLEAEESLARQKEANESAAAAGSGHQPDKGKGASKGPMAEELVARVAQQVTQQMIAVGWRPPVSMASEGTVPPLMLPPQGMPPQPNVGAGGIAPSVGFDGSGIVVNPRAGIREPLRFDTMSTTQWATMHESLVRAQNAMKAAMNSCVSNCRNIHNEVQVIENVLETVPAAEMTGRM